MEPVTDQTSSEQRASLDLRTRLTLAALYGFVLCSTAAGVAGGLAVGDLAASIALGAGATAVALLIVAVLLGIESTSTTS